MPGRKRPPPPMSGNRHVSARLRTTTSTSRRMEGEGEGSSNVPKIYRDMLVEAGVDTTRRDCESQFSTESKGYATHNYTIHGDSAELQPQTMHHDPEIDIGGDDDDDGNDDDESLQFEDVDINSALTDLSTPANSTLQGLELNLTAHTMARAAHPSSARRTKSATQVANRLRIQIHQMHLLCLLSHVSRRNQWCNDVEIQDALMPTLTENLLSLLAPDEHLPPSNRSQSLQRGLKQLAQIFGLRFQVTERGLRRALWATDKDELTNYKLSEDSESIKVKSDFLTAAQRLTGSRDVGAQLFCALLRSAGVETRLVCSLQPLALGAGAPTLSRRDLKHTLTSSAAHNSRATIAIYGDTSYPTNLTSSSPVRQRLGNPGRAAHEISATARSSSGSQQLITPLPRKIRGESCSPIYWVEVLDAAMQKWQPIDPLVTRTQYNPRLFEPPITDVENQMAYTVAFRADRSAKDVTRRYAKAYNAKTRRMRIDGAASTARFRERGMDGESWWRRVMAHFATLTPSDVDQIEDAELAAREAREPLPKNVADFKDHPVYALRRHLRKSEVLVPGARPVGTIGGRGQILVEPFYRRQDIRIARSRDKWWRLGQIVKAGEKPARILAKPAATTRDDADADPVTNGPVPAEQSSAGSELAGTPIYRADQTEIYWPPMVRDGKIPKNKFGNIDVYVPTMVPDGGIHITHLRTAEAAHLVGVDYAPALVGFEFTGRQGKPVLRGAVIPRESEEAVRLVIAALETRDRENEEVRRRQEVLCLWWSFLKGLRIRQRIWAGIPDAESEEAYPVDSVESNGGNGLASDTRPEALPQRQLDNHLPMPEIHDAGGMVHCDNHDGDSDDDDDDVAGGGFLVE